MVVVGLILAVFFGRDCSRSGSLDKTDTVYYETIRVDSFPVHDTVFVSIIDYVDRPVIVEVPTDSLAYLLPDIEKVRTYQRRYTSNGALINITSTTLGYLIKQNIEIADVRPKVIHTKTIHKTITIKKPQHGLFIGVHALQGYGVSADYLFKTGWSIGYQYTVIENTGANFITLRKKIL